MLAGCFQQSMQHICCSGILASFHVLFKTCLDLNEKSKSKTQNQVHLNSTSDPHIFAIISYPVFIFSVWQIILSYRKEGLGL